MVGVAIGAIEITVYFNDLPRSSFAGELNQFVIFALRMKLIR
jgi:hypothetical protein